MKNLNIQISDLCSEYLASKTGFYTLDEALKELHPEYHKDKIQEVLDTLDEINDILEGCKS